MKKILLLLLVQFSFLMSYAQNNNFKIDSTKSFYISYPEVWESEENTKPGVLMILSEELEDDKDIYKENFTVAFEAFKENNYSLQNYSKKAENTFLKYLKKSNVYKRETIKLDGKDTEKLFIDGKLGKYKLSFVQYHIVFDRQAYFINFSFETKKKEHYLNVLEHIMETFSFK